MELSVARDGRTATVAVTLVERHPVVEGTLPPEDLTCGPAPQHEPDSSSS